MIRIDHARPFVFVDSRFRGRRTQEDRTDERRERQHADTLGRATEEGATRLLLESELTKFGARIHGSGASNGFVKIQNDPRDIRPRGQFRGINVLWRW